MKPLFTVIICTALLGFSPTFAAELKVTGTVVGEKIVNSAIVDDTIWWEGTQRLITYQGKARLAKLVKVVPGKAIFRMRDRETGALCVVVIKLPKPEDN